MVRTVSSNESIKMREAKEVKIIPQGSVVNIDGFNTIITLEVALSDSLLLKSMDGTIRDLAAPISNSGRLKQRITELLNSFSEENNEVNYSDFAKQK